MDFIEEDDGMEDDENYIPCQQDKRSQEYLSVVISQETVDILKFYRNIVSPLIESYWLSAKHLFRLLPKPMEYHAFTTSLTDSAKDQLRQGLLCFREFFCPLSWPIIYSTLFADTFISYFLLSFLNTQRKA